VAAPAAADAELSQRLRDWAAAWSAKDVNQYLGFYANDFQPSKGNRGRWEGERRRLVGKPGPIDVTVANISTKPLPDGRVVTTFEQNYNSSNFKDRSRKALMWQKVGGTWVIAKETNR
jgi:adhesin transport system outer membrane protein